MTSENESNISGAEYGRIYVLRRNILLKTCTKKMPTYLKVICLKTSMALLMSSCFFSSHATEISGTQYDNIPLGTGFNSKSGKLFGQSFYAVKGVYNEDYGNTQAEVRIDVDLGYKELLDLVNGSLDAGVNTNKVSVDAGGAYATNFASDSYTGNYSVYMAIKPKKRLFIPEDNTGFVPTSDAINRVEQWPGNLLNEVGDEFVTAIEYGAYVMMNMKVEYKSAQDKQDISAYLGVDVVGLVGVKGDLAFIDAEKKKSVKITVKGVQYGGDPNALSKIIPINLTRCTLDNPQPCFDVFSEGIIYLKNDFPKQLTSLDTYNVTKIFTNEYKVSGGGLGALIPESGYEDVGYINKLLIKRLSDSWAQSMLDKRRAKNIDTYYALQLPEDLRNDIREIERSATTNASLYASTVAFCEDNPLGSHCVTRMDDILCDACGYLEPYDRRKLVLVDL
jgi:hypothetical protein